VEHNKEFYYIPTNSDASKKRLRIPKTGVQGLEQVSLVFPSPCSDHWN
jgi:hypothetical protein